MSRCTHYGCELEPEDGKRQCSEHLLYARRYQKSRRKKLIGHGKCTRCADRPARPGKTMCQECADSWNEYLRDRRART